MGSLEDLSLEQLSDLYHKTLTAYTNGEVNAWTLAAVGDAYTKKKQRMFWLK